MLTRKHFDLFAEEIRAAIADERDNTPGREALFDIARSLADRFRHENPRFNRHRFLVACGVDPINPVIN